MALQCVVTDHCIASVQTCEPIVFSYLHKHEMNINSEKYFISTTEHRFSSLSPPKLIYSSVGFVVNARRDTAAATGHAHLHILRANNIM